MGSDLKVEVRHLMDSITKRTRDYLIDNLELEVLECSLRLSKVHSLQLLHLTSLISVGGGINMYVAFSFEKQLIERIFTIYTADIEVPEHEYTLYLHETASDFINLIAGNATAELSQISKETIQLSPPVTISEAKHISRHKDVQFGTVLIKTIYGEMYIYFVGPQKLFDANLNYC